MSNYIGVRCPVCNKKFIQADDIVVCPVCGAPHHRDCYAQKSACAFADDHLRGMEWRPPPPDSQPRGYGGDAQPTESGAAICPTCRASNAANAIFCQRCGSRISDIPLPRTSAPGQFSWGFPGIMQELDPVSLMYGGLSPDDTIGGESVKDLAVYIGENSAYYLPRFKNMDDTSHTLSGNFSALIFGFLYYFHRKMYLVGAIMLSLFVIGAIPSFLQAWELLPQVMHSFGFGPEASVNQAAVDHYQSLVNMASSINLIIGLIVSFCANRFYYAKALADVKRIREQRGEPYDEAAYHRTLSLKGGVSRVAVFIVIGAIVAGYFIAASFMYYQYMETGGFFIP